MQSQLHRDVGIVDLNLTGDVPDTIGQGANIHVVATVGAYEPASCLVLLDRVSVSVR